VQSNTVSYSDRRGTNRFPIEQTVHYKTLNRRGESVAGDGKTINISSTGVLFSSQHDLVVGTLLELSIEWPAGGEGEKAHSLVAFGRVARASGYQLALRMERYEFRG
jgi:hypothetical protein